MKRIIRLTESDLTRIVRRTINEIEDEESTERRYDDSKNYGTDDESRYDDRNNRYGIMPDDDDDDDEDWGETDRGEEDLQDLIEEARDILENECGYDLHDINLMSEREMVDALFDEGYDEIASEMEELLDQEGF